MTWNDVHPDDYAMLADIYERHRRTGEAINVEYRISSYRW